MTTSSAVPTMLDRIRASLDALSPAERRVGKLLLLDPLTFSSLAVGELAERAHVSKPTVVRFCRSIGYEGLTDFKRKLAGVVNEGVPFVHRSVSEGDAPKEVLIKVIDNAASALLKYRNDASSAAYERAIEAIIKTARAGRRIEFYGVGNSGFVAMDAQHKFFRLGVNTVAYNDGHVQVMAASLLQPDDCAVLISNSGRSRDMIDAAEVAREQGATVIAITTSGSPVTKLAHVTITVDHPEDPARYSPMVSRLLHLLVLDVLCTGVALRLGRDVLPRLHTMKRNLDDRRYVSRP